MTNIRSYKTWSYETEQFVINSWGKIPVETIVASCGRSLNAIVQKARELDCDMDAYNDFDLQGSMPEIARLRYHNDRLMERLGETKDSLYDMTHHYFCMTFLCVATIITVMFL